MSLLRYTALRLLVLVVVGALLYIVTIYVLSRLSESPRQLRLADAGWASEQKASYGAVLLLQ